MNILFVVGSDRNGSFNQVVADYLMEKYKDIHNVKQANISEIPMFSQNIEKEKFDSVNENIENVKWADGVVIITPENNGAIPALLKNYLDWMSRVGRPFVGKPVMITGASPGYFGTLRAQTSLRQILVSKGLSTLIVPNVEVYITSVMKRIEDGKLKDDSAGSLVKGFENFIEFTEKNK